MTCKEGECGVSASIRRIVIICLLREPRECILDKCGKKVRVSYILIERHS
jgi:hypothetical protein